MLHHLSTSITDVIFHRHDQHNSEKPTEAKPPAVGDLVVSHWAGNIWSEGNVDSINGRRAKIVWTDNSSPSEVDLVDLPDAKGRRIGHDEGSRLRYHQEINRLELGAQVTMVSPGVITVKYVSDLDYG